MDNRAGPLVLILFILPWILVGIAAGIFLTGSQEEARTAPSIQIIENYKYNNNNDEAIEL